MSLFLQIMISIWVISTISAIIGYISSLSNRDSTILTKYICNSTTLNLFGKIFLNMLYLFVCPVISVVEWLIIAMTYKR